MEDQKKGSSFIVRLKNQSRCNGGFIKGVPYHQETLEKTTMKFLLKMQNKFPSLSEEENSAETYSSGKSGSDMNGNNGYSPQYVSSTVGISDSHIFNLLLPQWSKTARRGRKSLLAPASASSYTSLSSTEKEEEGASFGEVEAAHALLMLANGFSLDATEKLQRDIAKFPDYLQKKRKWEDTNIVCSEDGLKIARVDKEIENHRDEIILGTVKKTKLEAIHKQVRILSSASGTFNCYNCGRSFGSYQALGGHKSSCNSNHLKSETGKSTLQGSMRNTNNKSSSTVHQCKICSKRFPSGQALGGHQRQHNYKRESVHEPHVSRSSVSPPENISVGSLYPTNSLTSVQEAAEENINSTKVMLDLNEDPPKEEDDECIDFRCLELPMQLF